MSRHDVYRFRFAIGLATSRACSTKSCAIAPSVRFFSVTIPTGMCARGSAIGRTLTSWRFAGNLKADAGKIERKRPVAKRLIRTWGESLTTVVRG